MLGYGSQRTTAAKSTKQRQASDSAEKERERLILEHLPQVRLIARRIHDKLPSSVNYEDLVSTGIVGLIAAIDRFDPAHKVKLKTYAECKIRGAILDSLRELDWAPRRQRKQYKQIKAAIAAAEQRLQREPTEEEVAQGLNLTLAEYHQRLIAVSSLNLHGLQTPRSREENRDPFEFVASDEDQWPSRIMERSERQRLLLDAITRMPPTEQTVINLYYREELTLREIAQIVKLHESRVSQLKSQAILRLRSYVEKRWPVERGALQVNRSPKAQPRSTSIEAS